MVMPRDREGSNPVEASPRLFVCAKNMRSKHIDELRLPHVCSLTCLHHACQVEGEGEQLLWSQKLKDQLQQRLHAHSLALLDLAIVPAVSGHPRQAAILASSVPSDDEDGEVLLRLKLPSLLLFVSLRCALACFET